MKSTGTKPKSFYNLKDNFISSNCYTCVELNAHALVKKIMINDYEETFSNNFFIPDLYGSQPCESTFRQVRSFTSTYSTVVNFNMLEIIHRMKKVQLQNDIINDSKDEIKFPRFEKKMNRTANRAECYRMVRLTRETIIETIDKSMKTVISELNDLKIDTSKLDFHCQVKPVKEDELDVVDSFLSDDESDSDDIDSRNGTLDTDYVESEPDEEMMDDINTLSGKIIFLKFINLSCCHQVAIFHT